MPTPKKAYCFTLNNYSEDEYANLQRVCETESRYAILGRETGELGTAHIQGYILFTKPYRFSTIKSRYLPRCHIEVANGSPDSNKRYCSKDGDYQEFGSLPESSEGKSTRDEIARAFVSSMAAGRHGLAEFSDGNPGTWYYSGHNLLRNWLTIQPTVSRENVSVQWYVGKPGTGKSRRAHEELPEAYVKDPRTKWWNGYLLETDVIIDDFGPNGIDINHLLRWFDRYKCLVESKGGMLPLHAIKFIITSNFMPSDCFKSKDLSVSMCNEVDHPQLGALMRRINIINFDYMIEIKNINMHPPKIWVRAWLPLEKGARCPARLFLVCHTLVKVERRQYNPITAAGGHVIVLKSQPL